MVNVFMINLLLIKFDIDNHILVLELLDEIGTGMESVDGRINQEINQMRQVTRKPSLCGYYLLIIFLLLVLFVVLWLKL